MEFRWNKISKLFEEFCFTLGSTRRPMPGATADVAFVLGTVWASVEPVPYSNSSKQKQNNNRCDFQNCDHPMDVRTTPRFFKAKISGSYFMQEFVLRTDRIPTRYRRNTDVAFAPLTEVPC